MDIDQ